MTAKNLFMFVALMCLLPGLLLTFAPDLMAADRMAQAIIEEAEKRGTLRPGMTVVEYTAGSTATKFAPSPKPAPTKQPGSLPPARVFSLVHPPA